MISNALSSAPLQFELKEMKRRQEAAEEEERKRRQTEAEAKAAQEAEIEAARQAELSARDAADAPGSPGSNHDEAGKSSIPDSNLCRSPSPLLFYFTFVVFGSQTFYHHHSHPIIICGDYLPTFINYCTKEEPAHF